MKLVFVIVTILLIYNCSIIEMKSAPESNDPNIFKCKLCTEMIDVDFNYDQLMNNEDKIRSIKNYLLNEIGVEEKKVSEQFSKDNLEFLTKEISMQYFFKGSESKTAGDLKECIRVQTEQCKKIKIRLCEEILAIDNCDCKPSFKPSISNTFGILKNSKQNLIEGMLKNRKNVEKEQGSDQPSESNMDLISVMNKNSNFQGGLNISNLNSNSARNKASNYIGEKFLDLSKLENSTNMKQSLSKSINNLTKFSQINVNDIETLEDASKYNNMSLIDVDVPIPAPNIGIPHQVLEPLKPNFWTPPKPVLLDNFQNNLGSQLKDISILTTYGRV